MQCHYFTEWLRSLDPSEMMHLYLFSATDLYLYLYIDLTSSGCNIYWECFLGISVVCELLW